MNAARLCGGVLCSERNLLLRTYVVAVVLVDSEMEIVTRVLNIQAQDSKYLRIILVLLYTASR